MEHNEGAHRVDRKLAGVVRRRASTVQDERHQRHRLRGHDALDRLAVVLHKDAPQDVVPGDERCQRALERRLVEVPLQSNGVMDVICRKARRCAVKQPHEFLERRKRPGIGIGPAGNARVRAAALCGALLH